MNNRMVQASLIAGIAMGVLAAIPVINLVQCLFCGWVWISAILGVWYYRRSIGPADTVTSGQGMLIGIVAGLIGAVLSSILDYGINMVTGTGNLVLRTLAQQSPEIARNLGPVAANFGGFSIVGLLLGMVVFAIFGAIGGAIGAALFGKPRV